MKFMKRWQYLLLLIAGVFVAVSACTNDETPAPVTSITSISPTSAPVGSTIVITGTNFNTTPASNSVTFGTVPAQVVSATPTQLVVTVPANPGNPISVAANGQTAQFSGQFSLANKPVVEVATSITANTTWTASNVYLIRGFVYVRSGATLTIQPGTIIKGGGPATDPSGQSRGGTLVIQPGARIEARGTASQPIVFTSNAAPGQRKYGDWGGIVLIGKAPTNRPSATTFEGGIEGTFGTFNEPTDNSGTLQYVRIEFPGIALTTTSNSEINGLTLYGVGSGTTLDHIQVSYSGDDSFEWFGGTANAKYLVAYRGFDDDFDTDFGFIGKVQFALSLRDPNAADQSGSNSFESDNFNPGENTAAQGPAAPNNGLPLTQPVFANVSSFAFQSAPNTNPTSGGSGAYQSAMHLRRNTAISIYNSVFAGWPEGLRLDGTATGTLANVNSGALDLQGVTIANALTPVRGAAAITNDQATTFFNTTAKKNTIVASSDVAALLNAQSFNLTTPNFLPPSGSALLVGANAATGGKLADSFFTAAPYRGAFNGTDNWLATWTNFDPQNTNYDR
ncbi:MULTISPECIES: IPT/TIG domain-containing protein [Spirosoma]|uniref:Cell shape-determining protein MreB n=1 Tax=Spirosoma sordidisoli TaxID=2502893 RepID=A0A4Q2UKZ6_9BACT|nr:MULTISPECIES: IPT/TIG domain-containing protein [Spirosoma]RYC67509.1 cell shape-determining protein MreB [Spirosoma sordidisoli]